MAGIPKTVKIPTVKTFIGINKLIGEAIKLYPYKIKALIIILLKILNKFFNIISPLKDMILF